jgi:TetR/AcrR family transcriptional regulator, tetracycline repressor protein
VHTARRHARSDVVDKAVQLLDEYGIADLTMRRLARELNVSPGALYWHFANKQQLLGAVADRILASVDDVPASWRDRITGICGCLRDALLSHTDGAELVSASFAAGQSEAMAQILARLSAAAVEAGVESAHAELAARTVVYYVLGFTADEQSRLQWDAAGADLPYEQSVLSEDPSARFAFGVRLLVDGIAAHSGAEIDSSAGR